MRSRDDRVNVSLSETSSNVSALLLGRMPPPPPNWEVFSASPQINVPDQFNLSSIGVGVTSTTVAPRSLIHSSSVIGLSQIGDDVLADRSPKRGHHCEKGSYPRGVPAAS
jgi:hypothetical protein